MGDFILDLRKENRISQKKANSLKFYSDMEIKFIEYKKFSLALSSSDTSDIWKPVSLKEEQILVALCGRIALDKDQWKRSGLFEVSESAACKAILAKYRTDGLEKLLKYLNGNHVVFIFDGSINKFYMITDRWGMIPCFTHIKGSESTLFSSHPDILNKIEDSGTNLDYVSLTEYFDREIVSSLYLL